ncbi:MAG TPA: chromosome segregation protein ScpA [Phycisphaerae bacterium]|nr:chromosome segregation protein ScpA [Phycisphaerae bacterium]
MNEYRVDLDIYNGPLDLLLYLIRRDEVDICDIEVSRVTDQYIKHVDLLEQLDPNVAGDFLVMAATLLQIKSRMLLPAAEIDEGQDDADDLDPRSQLIRQLLEYKAFKDAASDLTVAGEHQGLKHPRKPIAPEFEKEKELEDVQVWDLFEAFNNLLTSIGMDKPTHDVIYDDTPIALHAEDIFDRLSREGPLSFERVFAGRTARVEIVGLFLALLELTRQGKVLIRQGGNFDRINISLNPDPPDKTEDEGEPEPSEDIMG